MIRRNERWDIPETMANAYEAAAASLDRYAADHEAAARDRAWRESIRRHNENANADGIGVRNGHDAKHGRCSHVDCILVRR